MPENTPEKKPTVLVVDDERDQTEIFRLFLPTKGYNVLTANSGRAAFSLWEEHRPEIVLTDMAMPEGNGLELIAWIRRAEEEQADEEKFFPTQIAALSTRGVSPEALALYGVTDYLEKPFNFDDDVLPLLEDITERLRAGFTEPSI